MANAQINIAINATGNASVVLGGLQRQFGSFFSTLKTGFNLNLGAKLANMVLNLPQSIRQLAQFADGIAEFARKSDLGYESSQVLARSLRQNGADAESLTTTFTELRTAQQEAADGSERARDAFRALGLEWQELARQPLPLQLEAIARAMASAENPTEALNAATEILGRRNIPKLRASLDDLAAKGFAGMAAEAQKAGAVLDEDLGREFGKLDDRFDDFLQRGKVLLVEFLAIGQPVFDLLLRIGDFLLTIFQRVIVAINRVMRAIGAMIEVLTTDLTLADANKILEGAAADDDRRLSGGGAINAGPGGNAPVRQSARKLDDLSDEERTHYDALLSRGQQGERDVQLGLAELDRNFGITSEQRRNAISNLLRARLVEIRVLQAQLDSLISNLDADDPRRSGLEQLRERLTDQATGTTQELLNTNAGPQNVGEGVTAGTVGFLDEVGTLAEQVAGTIRGTLGEAVSSISDGIYSWATGASSVRDALTQVGQTIGQQVLRRIIEMGTQWVVSEVIIKTGMLAISALGSLIRKKDAAEHVATEGVKAAASAPSAILTSISSFGAAAVIGLALALAAVAAFSAFADGGAVRGPGTSTSDSILARLSDGEFVMRASATRQIGLRNLETMNQTGRLPVYADGGLVGSEGAITGSDASRQPMQIVLVDSDRAARRIEKNSEAETQIIQLIRNRRYEILA